jgi:hypothetical protein
MLKSTIDRHSDVSNGIANPPVLKVGHHALIAMCSFAAARNLDLVGDGLRALALMRESKAWNRAEAMPKSESKSQA